MDHLDPHTAIREQHSVPAGRIHAALNAVARELAQSGISKDRTNSQGNGAGFKFRGIDDVMNAAGPLLAKHSINVIPRYANRQQTERSSSKGGTLFCVTLEASFDLVHAEDGSRVTLGPVFGEAFDSGDKATNKAMSIALKYAILQAFMVPTESTPDPDENTHTVQGIWGKVHAALDAATNKDEVLAIRKQFWGAVKDVENGQKTLDGMAKTALARIANGRAFSGGRYDPEPDEVPEADSELIP